MKSKKQKKIAKKAFEEFINSGYVIEHLRQIFRMQDYSDRDIIEAFKYAVKQVREANEEKWEFKGLKKKREDDEDYENFHDQSERTRLDPKDKRKVVGRGRTSAAIEDLESFLR